MARHIMAVCVVCLLCADHLPCKEHFLASDEKNNDRNVGNSNQIYPIDNNVQYGGIELITKNSNHFYNKRKEKRLVKRHNHDHDHDHHNHQHSSHEHIDQDVDPKIVKIKKNIKEKIEEFTNKLFDEYGNSELNIMNITGFETMMKSLDLYHLITDSVTAESSKKPNEDSNSCINSVDFLRRTTIQSESPHHHHNDHERPHSTPTSDNNEKGITSLEQWKDVLQINKEDLQNICPILLYQLTRKNSTLKAGCIQKEYLPQIVNYTEPHIAIEEIDTLVWVYSTLAVLGVSLCGLLGVAVIPCMDKHFYHHALQFLVALAIGTLCGDALLHLLPHAMMEQTLENPHEDAMFKGLAAVAGILFFYFMERILNVVAEFYKHRQKKDAPSSRVRVMKDPDACSLHNNTSSGEKQCKHKYSSYPYCYDEIAMETKDDHHEHNHISHSHLNNHNSNFVKCSNHGEHGDHSSEYAGLTSKEESTLDNNTISTNLDDASIESEITNHQKGTKILPSETYTIILREHETKHHGHSHTHGHVHSPPGSFSAVAWMVIMGDGLHNFTDGMTIGAAFANNLAGGFSTAIAVFCHELPHELGDFAVLLKAGMSAYQAVYYNMLSSLLSFFGMLLGIYFGNTPEASAWVFSVAAGLFIYIALVDMVPELTSSHGAEERCKASEFILQFIGMTIGFLIMLLIAKYEHELKMIFVPIRED